MLGIAFMLDPSAALNASPGYKELVYKAIAVTRRREFAEDVILMFIKVLCDA